MLDLARMSDADLVSHYEAEQEIWNWCWSECQRVAERVRATKDEIMRRGPVDRPVEHATLYTTIEEEVPF